MFVKLLLAFTLIPLAEITLLIELGGAIGVLNTIGIVLLTALAGAYLARLEGTRTLMHIKSSMNRGIMPTEELIDAVIIFAAGVVLLTPGFLTDIGGLLLLFPPTRAIFRQWIKRYFSDKINQRHIHVDHF